MSTTKSLVIMNIKYPVKIKFLENGGVKDKVVGVVGGAHSGVSLQRVTRFEKRGKCVEMRKEIGNDKIMIFVEKKIDADRLRLYLCQKGKIKSILFFFCEILILNK
jgi:hypothetical protein